VKSIHSSYLLFEKPEAKLVAGVKVVAATAVVRAVVRVAVVRAAARAAARAVAMAAVTEAVATAAARAAAEMDLHKLHSQSHVYDVRLHPNRHLFEHTWYIPQLVLCLNL
jgi:hypothetical protein